MGLLDLKIARLEERVAKLEERLAKPISGKKTTIRQQLLFLKYLGFLDILDRLKLTRENKAKLLSVILNGSFGNIRGYLSEINKKESLFATDDNYTTVLKTFKELDLKSHSEEVERILKQIGTRESENR